ncbi:glycosyltransferase family 4 protein [Tautonia plasticadhaerens]|uniref:Glycogen synthase n=1 Tax=Tautonia plasticadhaerens TaxID=2527974 RepID=A0A518GVC4_9BACT|nr:glycosyltransferase family 4 protein [Tautonia plasticadhaerens]QDV32540.1 Glycogen synthase [Tautonia plasticadhaerens]
MKILVLSNFYPPEVLGGFELACAQAVEALRRRGHEVLVVTAAARGYCPPEPHVRRAFSIADIWNLDAMARRPAVVQRLMDAESRLISSFNVRALAEAVDAFRPDVAYVHNLTGLGGLGLMAALGHLGVPWVWQLGDSVPSYCCSLWGEVMPALAERFGAEIRGTFIAVSSRLVAEIEGLGVPLRGRVELLPYWIDGRPGPVPRRSVRNGPLRVVSAGRLTPYKGVDVLIEAAGLVRRSRWSVEIDFYGAVSDVDPNHYPALLQQHGVEDRVRFLGPLDHASLIGRYGDYEAFAFPTWEREPFGIGPIEAAAHGGCLPIISRSCGLAEWLVHGVHCLKVEPTAQDLARAFLDLLEWRIDPGPIAGRARSATWRDFHVDALAPRIEALLADAASSASPSASGSPDEVVRLARLAEGLAQSIIAEAA